VAERERRENAEVTVLLHHNTPSRAVHNEFLVLLISSFSVSIHYAGLFSWLFVLLPAAAWASQDGSHLLSQSYPQMMFCPQGSSQRNV
jgi:hypothetical protein